MSLGDSNPHESCPSAVFQTAASTIPPNAHYIGNFTIGSGGWIHNIITSAAYYAAWLWVWERGTRPIDSVR